MAAPQITAIMIFYNPGAFITQAIESVLAQTHPSWELILVDDGSTDTSTATARHFAQLHPDRIRYVEHPGHKNRGMSASRNLGLGLARGRYVGFLDADDMWFPGALAEQAALLDAHPDAAMVYGSALWWYSWTGRPEDEGRNWRDRVEQSAAALVESSRGLIHPPRLLEFFLRDGLALPCLCCAMFRREVLEAVGGFEPLFHGMYEDQALFAKIVLRSPVLPADACWARYRQHADSACARAARDHDLQAARRRYLQWLEQYLARQGAQAGPVWDALQDALWPHRHPAAGVQVMTIDRSQPDYQRLHGAHLELPAEGMAADPRAVPLAGWVLGRGSRAVAAEVWKGASLVRRIPVEVARPDIAAAFDVPGAERSGFHATLDLLAIAGGDLDVRAVMDDAGVFPLGRIRTRRRWLKRARRGRKPTRQGRTLIFLYHRVAALECDPWALAVTPQHFQEHLEVLARYTHPIRLDALDAGSPLRSDPSVAITFDDGYADNLLAAKPLLERYALPATLFATAGYIGTGQEFWWDELERLLLHPGSLPERLSLTLHGNHLDHNLGDDAHYSRDRAVRHTTWKGWQEPPTLRHALYRELYNLLHGLDHEERQRGLEELRRWAGFVQEARPSHRVMTPNELRDMAAGGVVEIGAHGLTHVRLGGLPPDIQRREIAAGKLRLEEMIARPVTSFAYPYGGDGDFDAASLAAVRLAGFARACKATGGRLRDADKPDALPRVEVQDCDGDEFARRLTRWLYE